MITPEVASLSGIVRNLADRVQLLESRGLPAIPYGRWTAVNTLTASASTQNPAGTVTPWTLDDDDDPPVTVTAANEFSANMDGLYAGHMTLQSAGVPTGRTFATWFLDSTTGLALARYPWDTSDNRGSPIFIRNVVAGQLFLPRIYFTYTTAPSVTSEVNIAYLGPVRKTLDEEET